VPGETTAQIQESSLRKELGLRDLVLAQDVAFWLGAMLMFYLPLAAVVIRLNRMMPLEGGLYQWAKSGYGEMAGFLTAWNLWVYAIASTGAVIFVIPTDFSYMAGPSLAWVPGSKIATLAITGGVMLAITLVAIRGLEIGKWLHNIGTVMILTAYAILFALPVWALWRGSISHFDPFPWQPPRPRSPSERTRMSPRTTLRVAAEARAWVRPVRFCGRRVAGRASVRRPVSPSAGREYPLPPASETSAPV
jgi:glutamate:GABA antiporter